METEHYRKKLRYLCARRATQELEIILGRFWKKEGSRLPPRLLPELEKILQMEDLDLLAVLLGQRDAPPDLDQSLMKRLIDIALKAR